MGRPSVRWRATPGVRVCGAVGGGVQQALGRHDEVVAFNVAGGRADADADSLVVGVHRDADAPNGPQTERLAGTTLRARSCRAEGRRGVRL